jgi:hypothetical protein
VESQNAQPKRPEGVSDEPGMREALPRDMRTAGMDDSQQEARYVAKTGDTYEDIAQKLGITVSQLLERNPFLDPNRINAGQTLRIPQAIARANGESMETKAQDPNEDPKAQSVSSLGMTPALPRSEVEPELASIWDCPADHVWIVLPSSWDVVSVLRYYNISYQALAESNPQADLEALEAGQNLCIPPSGSRGHCEGGDVRCYILGDEDNLDTLADASGYSVCEILRMNPCLAPNDFVKGCTVCLPAD